jgi:hypothetical protein
VFLVQRVKCMVAAILVHVDNQERNAVPQRRAHLRARPLRSIAFQLCGCDHFSHSLSDFQ